jgi:hypothetical protein
VDVGQRGIVRRVVPTRFAPPVPDGGMPGRYRNGRISNLLAGATVLATSALSVILLAVTVLGA